MWFKSPDLKPVPEAALLKRTCENCGNETEQILLDHPYGLMLGLPFMKRPWASTHKGYYLGCPICTTVFRISKEQATALIRKGKDPKK